MIWRRLVSKAAMRGVGKEMAKYLGDFQFGVGVPSGAEAVLHSANRFLNEFHSDGFLAMLTVDFTNAFNLVSRTALLHEVRTRCPSSSLWVDFLYGQPARLYVGNTHMWSTTGVQQGDPLGPLLFALHALEGRESFPVSPHTLNPHESPESDSSLCETDGNYNLKVMTHERHCVRAKVGAVMLDDKKLRQLVPEFQTVR
ncbi:hypothetical protein E3N88_29339 [Mikania micrantha]|uniref:Reverse transcriptase domain-containing protein n=1 Tax=Mikania micrantha TaxID=192012 RepID=A0A5N6MJ70_9ASTR|nr:hypothetical protein E3N88_29339 [Mikania micrantha]